MELRWVLRRNGSPLNGAVSFMIVLYSIVLCVFSRGEFYGASKQHRSYSAENSLEILI